jgi:phosphoenolpyruvate carboxylase
MDTTHRKQVELLKTWRSGKFVDQPEQLQMDLLPTINAIAGTNRYTG